MKQTVRISSEKNLVFEADKSCLVVLKSVEYRHCHEDDLHFVSDSGSCVDEYYVLRQGQKIWIESNPDKISGEVEVEWETEPIENDSLFSHMKELADLASRYPVLEEEKRELMDAHDFLQKKLLEEKEKNQGFVKKVKNRLKK